MPRLVECDSCGHKYRMPDHLAGQTVPCKECGADIEIPGRRRPRVDSRGSWLSANMMWVALAGGGLLVAIMVVVWLMGRGGNPAPVANNNPGLPGNGAAPGLPRANPGLPRANPGNDPASNPSSPPNVAQTPASASVPAQQVAPQNTNSGRPATTATARGNANAARTGRGGFGLSQPTGSEIESLLRKRDGKPVDEVAARPDETLVTFARQAGQPERVGTTITAPSPDQWGVTPDPLPESVTFSSKPLNVPGPERSKLIVSRMLSPVAMFGDPSGDFVLVNLSTMTQSKPLRMPLASRSFAISPDGDKIANLSSSDQTSSEIGVFQTSNSRLLRTLTVEGRVSDELFEFLDPNRLVVSLNSSGGRERLAVIDLGSGDKLCEPVLGDDGRFAQVQISPGGRYLLHVDQKQGLIVSDSRSGSRVGQVPLPRFHQHERNVQVIAAGVSPDGQEFAAFCDDLSQQHLLVWNLGTGTLTQHHVLESPELRSLRFGSSRPTKVEFLNDGSGFLIDGAVWIDRLSGGIAWQDRDAQARLNRDSVRRLLPDNRLLLVETRERNFSVARDRPNARLMALDLGRISGRSLSRGEEPDEPVVAKTANARRITLPADNVAWNVAADPAPSRAPLKRPQILGQGINGAASDFQYTLNASRLAIVDVPRRSSGSLGTAARLRAFDLSSGGLLFETAVPPQTVALDISSDGRWLATTRGPGAIALWEFDGARPKLTFVPHKSSGRIQLCRFLNDGQLLVSSEESRERHRVSLWKVPECEQVYELELGTREVALRNPGNTTKGPFPARAQRFSHGGRYLVIDEGDRFRFLEVATGNIVGDLANAWPRISHFGTESWDLTPFSADGRMFAALLPYDSFDLLTVWDVTTGQLREQFSLSRNSSFNVMGSSGSMHFCGKNQLLLEDKLIDLTQHAVIWSYPFLRGVRLLDGSSRMQRLLDVPFNRGTVSVLAESEFPLENALAEVREARSEPLPLVFGHGTKVTLDVSQLGSVTAEVQARIKAATEEACRQYGIELIPNAPVVLSLSVIAGKTETRTYQSRGFGQKQDTVQVSGTDYRLRAALSSANTEPFWVHESGASTHPGSFQSNEGESGAAAGQRAGAQSLAFGVERFFTHLQLPPMLYAQPRQEKPFPALGFGTTTVQQLPQPEPAALNAALANTIEMQRKSFEYHCQDVAHRLYADAISSDDPAAGERWKWSAALQRPMIGLRWGFAVQYSGKKPDGVFVFPQPNYPSVVESLNNLTAGAGPRLIDNVEYLASQGRFGLWPVGRNSHAREVVLIGGGSLGELLEAAKSTRLDFLIAAHFTTQAGGPGTAKKKASTTAMTFRLFDVSTGKMVFETSPLKAADLNKTDKDASAEAADEMLRFVEEQVALKPLEELPKEALKARLDALNAKDSANPIADVAEFQFLVAKGWTTEPQVQRAASRLLGDAASANKLLHGTPEERKSLAAKLEPREVKAK